MSPSPLEVPIEINGDEVTITQGDRRYRVLGVEKNTSLGILRLNVLVTRGEGLHVCPSPSPRSLGVAYLSDAKGKKLGATSLGWSDWVTVPSDGRVDLRFDSPGGSLQCSGVAQLDFGVSVEGYQYQQYQVGSAPVWPPLRFPGQYYDVETDLFENWHRYYNPSIGSYLQPDETLRSSGTGVVATI
jgi:RHS repeat-associated protein